MLFKKLFFAFIIIFFIISSKYSLSQEEFEMKFGDTTVTMKKYIFCKYVRGMNYELDSTDIKQINKDHLLFIGRLYQKGIILIAGPTDDDINFKGILIFNLNDIKKAEDFIKKDPSVIRGDLSYRLYYWWAIKGSSLK